ncbi:MAG TPA: hypothetical protein VJX48_09585 [Xanthobacteraceae bacterium]|nr:hypothetical protein [Xanthobacteraceae bacterium]
MTVDDFSTPLGQQLAKRRRRLPIAVPHVVAGALALFFALFVVWVIVGDGSFGGEPTVTVPIDLHAVKVVTKPDAMAPPQTTAGVQVPDRPAVTGPPASALPPDQGAPASTRTVTIIDGTTGARQEVVIPAAAPGTGEGGEKPLLAPSSHRRGNGEGEGKLKLKGSE